MLTMRPSLNCSAMMSHDGSDSCIPDLGSLLTRLQETCDVIVGHLHDVSSGQARVARMELLFKVDTNNKYVGDAPG